MISGLLEDWIGVYGAALTTLLAFLKVRESYMDRRLHLSTIATFTSSPDIGNTITLLNASKFPVNIHYFELVWIRPGRLGQLSRWIPFWFETVREESPLEGDGCNMTVAPHSQYALPFREGNHFPWAGKFADTDIYIKLWLVGRRKPLWRRLD